MKSLKMSTLVSAYQNDRLKRTCNATCYNANGKTCHCICAGHNHGVGLDQAELNTAKISKQGAQKYLDDNPTLTKIILTPRQLKLFAQQE
jgi:hypothetical protein